MGVALAPRHKPLKHTRPKLPEWVAGTVLLVLAMTCAALAAAEELPNNNTARVVSVAQDFVRSGKYGQAAEILETHLATAGDDNLARLEYARVLMFRRRDAEALFNYKRVLASEPHNPAALVGVAKITSWQGDFAGALEIYERVLNRNPRYYDALAGKAFTLNWLARNEEAKAAFATLASYHRVDKEVAAAMRELGVSAPGAAAVENSRATPAKNLLPAPRARAPRAETVEITKRESVPVLEMREREPEPQPARKPVMWAASGVVVALVGFGMAFTRRARRYLRTAPMPVAILPTPRTVEVHMPRAEAAPRRARVEEPLEGARLLLIGREENLMDQLAAPLNIAGAHVAVALEQRQAERLLAMGEFDAIIVQRGAGDEPIYERLKQRGEERCMMLVVSGGEMPPMRVLRLNQPFHREELLSMARLLVRRATRAT